MRLLAWSKSEHFADTFVVKWVTSIRWFSNIIFNSIIFDPTVQFQIPSLTRGANTLTTKPHATTKTSSLHTSLLDT